MLLFWPCKTQQIPSCGDKAGGGGGAWLPLAAIFILPPSPNSLPGPLRYSLAKIAKCFQHSKGSPGIQKRSPAKATIGRGKTSPGAQTARLSCLPTWALKQLQRSLPPSSLAEIIGDRRLFHHLSHPGLFNYGLWVQWNQREKGCQMFFRCHAHTPAPSKRLLWGPPGRGKRWADKPGSTETGAFPGSYRASSSNRALLKDPEAALLFVSYCLKGKNAEDPSLPVMTFPQPTGTFPVLFPQSDDAPTTSPTLLQSGSQMCQSTENIKGWKTKVCVCVCV